MKNPHLSLLLILLMLVMAESARSSAIVNNPAPAFKATDSLGKAVDLVNLRGKFVVLEWLHPGCPFTKKHYHSSNMQALQSRYTEKGVVWLSVFTSRETHGPFLGSDEMNAWMETVEAKPTALILDTSTELGKLYGAKTTPHMFVIDPTGSLIYAGAIDSKNGFTADEIDDAVNYVSAALDEAMAGKPVITAQTRPYGCPVKYH